MNQGVTTKYIFRTVVTVAVTSLLGMTPVSAQDKKPNILVVWGDDIGNTNISANTHGLMGYRTA